MKFKAKIIRAGVWFRALRRIDRALIDLTIRVKDSVRSAALAECLFTVMKKFEGLLMSSFQRAIREVGLPLAQRLSSIAQKWGNASAKCWASDISYTMYLAMMHMCRPKGFRA